LSNSYFFTFWNFPIKKSEEVVIELGVGLNGERRGRRGLQRRVLGIQGINIPLVFTRRGLVFYSIYECSCPSVFLFSGKSQDEQAVDCARSYRR
jgi:hypothetical protein